MMIIPDLNRDDKHGLIGQIIQLEYPVEWKIATAEDTFVRENARQSGPTDMDRATAEETVNARYAELEPKSIPALQQIEYQIRKAKAEEADKALWFSRPNAKADIFYWSKRLRWTIDEGTALLFDKDPSRVSWEGIRRRPASPFAKKYEQARSLILEAVEHQFLPDPLVPADFLRWAKRMHFPLPEKLADAVLRDDAHPSVGVSGEEGAPDLWQEGQFDMPVEPTNSEPVLTSIQTSGAASHQSEESINRRLVGSQGAIVDKWPTNCSGPSTFDVQRTVSAIRESGSGPVGLTNQQIATVFQNLHFNDKQWKRNLADPPLWLKEARLHRGERSRKHPARWDPVRIALAFLDKGIPLKKIDLAFFSHAKIMADWRTVWDEKSDLFRG